MGRRTGLLIPYQLVVGLKLKTENKKNINIKLQKKFCHEPHRDLVHINLSGVVNPDPNLFPGFRIICSGSGKNERAGKQKFYYNFRPVNFGQNLVRNRKRQIVGGFFFLIDFKVLLKNKFLDIF